MMGRFVAVVGASGVGKDSVMTAMAARDPRICLAKRVITRSNDAGGEDFEGVTAQAFLARKAAGHFALSWAAHGLLYAIPKSVQMPLDAGQDVLANLSRKALVHARDCFAPFAVIHLTTHPDVLAARLTARGRETSAQINDRLTRAFDPLPDGIAAFDIDNSGALDHAVDTALACLYPVKA